MTRRGVTLIELLMAIVIGAIAMFALVPPLVAERVFWGNTQRQTEAQRDAQMVLRAMARAGRECQGYNRPGFFSPVPGADTTLSFDGCLGVSICFGGGPSFNGGQMVQRSPNCQTPGGEKVLIDAVRSKVANFTITQVIPNKLVRIHLKVTHRLQTTDTRTPGDEILETEIFLRNAT